MGMTKSWGDVKNNPRDEKWEDNVEWMEFLDGKQFIIRPVGPVLVLARHWIETLSGKNFPADCTRFDPATEEFLEDRPCAPHDDFGLKARKSIYFNAIIRRLQEKGDDNPIRGCSLPSGVQTELKNIIDYIKCDPSDPDKGIDLVIKYDSKAEVAAKKWYVGRGDRTPLTAEERKFKLFDWEKVGAPDFSDSKVCAETARSVKESMARQMWYVVKQPDGTFKGDINGKPWSDFSELVEADKNKINPRMYNEQIAGKSGGKKPKADDDDDDELPPRRSAKTEEEAPASKKPKPAADDDDEAPAPKKPAKTDDDDDAPPAKPAKPATSDDDDDKPAPKKVAPVDDDDEPAPKKVEAKKPVADDDDAPAPKKEVKKEEPADGEEKNIHPDPKIKNKKHKSGMTVPECFETYDGSRKCNQCPVKTKCIDLTPED